MFLKDILIDSSDKIVDRKMTVDVFVDNLTFLINKIFNLYEIKTFTVKNQQILKSKNFECEIKRVTLQINKMRYQG